MKWIGASPEIDEFDLVGSRMRIRVALQQPRRIDPFRDVAGVELVDRHGRGFDIPWLQPVLSGYEMFLIGKYGVPGLSLEEMARRRRVADWTGQAYAYIARNPGGGSKSASMASEATVKGRIKILDSVAKSNREAARLAGLDEKNLRRYRGGASPTAGNDMKLLQAVRRLRLKPGREKLLRATTPPVTATATIRVSKDSRKRDINLTDYVQQADWDRVVDTFISAGDLSGAVEEMVINAIGEYLAEAEVESVDDVKIGAKR